MEHIVDQSLKEIAKGSWIYLIGIIIGTLLGFLSRVLIVRYVTQTEYGIYSLALVLFSILVIVSILGLQEGATRQIAYFREKNEAIVRGVISSSLQIVIVASLLLSAVLFLSSNVISTKLFHNAGLSRPLKMFSIAIPFCALIKMFTSIFRGFDRVDVKVYFQDILRNVLFISFLIVVIVFGLSFMGVIYAFVASFAITCVAFAIYTMRSPIPKKIEKHFDLSPVRKELLLFSLPLLVTLMLHMIFVWGDTLMLGYFKSPYEVGLYNTAYPLALFIPIILTAAEFIYVPIASQLYSKNLIAEMGRTYQILTKWIYSASLPLFIVLFLFPEMVLCFFFGANYVPASLTLRILTLGFMFHVFLGLNGVSLLVLGKTKLLMFIGVIATLINVILNIILIPPLGIEGAALASTISYFISNVIISIKLYQISKIHPFSKNCLKLVGNSIILLVLIYIISFFIDIKPLMLLVLLTIYLSGYFILMLLTKSLDKEDNILLLALEKIIGVNFTPIKKRLKIPQSAVATKIEEEKFIPIVSGETTGFPKKVKTVIHGRKLEHILKWFENWKKPIEDKKLSRRKEDMAKKLQSAVATKITEEKFISTVSGENTEVAEMQAMFARLAKAPEMPEAPKELIISEDVDIGSFMRKMRELFKQKNFQKNEK